MWEIRFYRRVVNQEGRERATILECIAVAEAANAGNARAIAIAEFERNHRLTCWDQLAHDVSVAEAA